MLTPMLKKVVYAQTYRTLFYINLKGHIFDIKSAPNLRAFFGHECEKWTFWLDKNGEADMNRYVSAFK